MSGKRIFVIFCVLLLIALFAGHVLYATGENDSSYDSVAKMFAERLLSGELSRYKQHGEFIISENDSSDPLWYVSAYEKYDDMQRIYLSEFKGICADECVKYLFTDPRWNILSADKKCYEENWEKISVGDVEVYCVEEDEYSVQYNVAADIAYIRGEYEKYDTVWLRVFVSKHDSVDYLTDEDETGLVVRYSSATFVTP